MSTHMLHSTITVMQFLKNELPSPILGRKEFGVCVPLLSIAERRATVFCLFVYKEMNGL